MRTIYISLTYLDTIEIEDDADVDEAVLEYVSENYQDGYNDLDINEMKEGGF